MLNKKIFLILLIHIFLISFISSAELTTTSTTIDYKGHTIIPTLDPKTTIDDKVYSLITDKNSFYITPKDAKPFTLKNYYIKLDFNPDAGIDGKTLWSNSFGSQIQESRFDDSQFMAKNKITSREVMVIDEKGIWWTIENWFKNIFGMKPTPAYTYIINYTGIINDTDPTFFETISTTTTGTFNDTEASSLGVRGYASSLFMDFNSPAEAPLGVYSSSIGTYVKDGSIYNNYGTISGNNGSSPWVAGNFSNALYFDGLNDYIPMTGTMIKPTNLTISFWMKPASTPSASQYLIEANTFQRLRIYYNNQNRTATTLGSDSSSIATITNSNNASVWSHIVLTINILNSTTGNQSIYSNGVYITSKLFNDTVTNPSTFNVGTLTAASYWNGTLDELMVFNRSLSATEINNIYKNQSANIDDVLINDANLLAYWRFNESIGLIAKDERGINNGTLTNYDLTSPNYNPTGGYDNSGYYSFDGIDDNINILDNDALSFGGSSYDKPFTISTYINTKGQTISKAIVGKYSSVGYEYYSYMDSSNRVGMILRDASAAVNAQAYTTATFSNNTWYNAVITYDGRGGANAGNGITIYINGINYPTTVVNSASYVAMENGVSPLCLGSTCGGSSFFNGSIDQVTILPYALTGNEVVCLYNGTGCGVNNSNYISKYVPASAKKDFTSFVFYNTTNTFWNITLSTADTTSRSGMVNADNSINASNPNLIGYWRLNGDFVDVIGKNNGTPLNGVNNATGLVSQAMRFDGVNDYINVSTTFATDSHPNISYSFWVYLSNNSLKGTFINDGSNVNGFSMGVGAPSNYDSVGNTLIMVYNGVTYLGGTVSIGTGWHHINIILPTNNKALAYLDGINVFNYTGSSTMIASTGNIQLGRYSTANPRYFSGSMDEVLIYNKSLSLSEISQIYKSGLSQKATTNITIQTRTGSSYNISDPSLVGFWAFNNDTGENDTYFKDELGRTNMTCVSATACPNWNLGNGSVGGGLNFDGGDYLSAQTISIVGNISAGAWVYSSNYAQNGFIVQKAPVNTQWELFFSSTDRKLYWAGGSTNSITCPVPSNNRWHHIFATQNGTTARLYIDGVQCNAGTVTTIANGADLIWIGALDASNYRFTGAIDEVRIYNRSLSADEVLDLYNFGTTHINWNNVSYTSESLVTNGVGQTTNASGANGAGKFFQFKANFYSNDTAITPYLNNYNVTNIANQPPQIIYDSQVPFPLNLSNAIGPQGTNFTYNISDVDDGLSLTNLDLFYKVNDTDDNNMFYQNGTGYAGYFAQNTPTNISNKFTWNLLDNSYLPGTYNVGAVSIDNQPHYKFPLTASNQYLSIEILNMSKIRQLGFFELMVNRSAGTGELRAYYCNSTWDINSPVGVNPYCLEFYALTSNVYDHCHTNQSCHMLFPFTNFSIVSQKGYFVLRGRSGSTWDIWYANGNVRADYVKYSTTGVSYTSNNTINPDGHLHQFGANTTLYTYACANDTIGATNCTSIRSQDIAGTVLSPTGLSVLNPTNTTYEKGDITINYTQCYSPSSTAISYYNITLINPDNTYNKTIVENNTLNLNYTWNSLTTTSGSYKVEVKCYDVLGASALARSDVFTLIDDATPPSVNLLLHNLPAFNWAEFNWTIIDLNVGSAINLTIWKTSNLLFRIANSPTNPYLFNGLQDSTNYTAIVWVNDTYGNKNYTTLNFTTKYAYNDTRWDYNMTINETDPIWNATLPQSCPTGYVVNGTYSNGTISCTVQSGTSGKQKICINKPISQYDDCSIYGTCKYCYYV